MDKNVLANYKKPLSRISEGLLKLEYEVCSYDGVMKKYCRELHSSSLCSFDAYISCGGKHFLVEFKNENICAKEQKKDYRLKMSEGLLVFNDIIGENISFDRKNVTYCLVYGKDKNGEYEERKKSFFADIMNKRAQKSKETFLLEGYDFFKKLFFNDVWIVDEVTFDKMIDFKDNKISKVKPPVEAQI